MFRNLSKLVIVAICLISFSSFADTYYCNGQKQADSWGSYYPNGKKISDGWGTYYPNGTKLSDSWGTYHYNGQKYKDNWGTYYPNGKKTKDAWGIYYDNGQKVQDAWGCYDQTGRKLASCPSEVRGRMKLNTDTRLIYTLDIASGEIVDAEIKVRDQNTKVSTIFNVDLVNSTINYVDASCDQFDRDRF